MYPVLLIVTFAYLSISGKSSKIEVDVCYNHTFEGFRLDATILKNIAVSDWIDCVVECATEPCCRSINYNNKEPLNMKNETNCEMLHNVVHNTSQKFLKKNSSYDHVFLMNPQKEYNETCLAKILEQNITAKCSVKTTDEKCCVFPFIYLGISYSECTNVHAFWSSYWCSTTQNYDVDKQWGHCKRPKCAVKTANGKCCVFPFAYEGKAYSACTLDGSFIPRYWCSTTENFDLEKNQWGRCQTKGP